MEGIRIIRSKAMNSYAEGLDMESEPVSPTGLYFNSSVLSVCILAVLESQVPIDDSPTMTLLNDVFLPINSRFSTVMVRDENGVMKWKKVEVNLKDHVKIPVFPSGLASYDNYVSEYISNLSMEQLPQSQPLWELHLIKYPTSQAAGTCVFKLHHALGDGYSLMGALLSCLQNADDPSRPLTFPALRAGAPPDIPLMNILTSAFNTLSDFGWSLLKSCWIEDDRSSIRSANVGLEFKPMVISTITFSLDQIKEIKTKLGATVNDVITGIIFFGTRLYMMEETSKKMSNEDATALVLLNTRNIGGYKSVKEMITRNGDKIWGNQFAFMHISVPKLYSEHVNPLEFVWKAQEMIKRKRNSAAVHLNAQLLEATRKLRGPESAARIIHRTLRNSSMSISNLIGPVEAMTLANHPVNGLYFMNTGGPEGLTITMVSYLGKLRVAVGTEKDFIDEKNFMAAVESAFELIFKAALGADQTAK